MQAMSQSVWLTIDIGNSAIKAGLFLGDQLHEHTTVSSLVEFLRQLNDWNTHQPFERVGLCSVVPDLAENLEMQLKMFTSAPILRLNSNLFLPINVNYNPIESLGLDRLASACAGAGWSTGQDATIIIDAGSAITIDLVTKDGGFEGGVIMPGPQISNLAVKDYTANLEAVPLVLPDGVLGNSTLESLQLGITYGMIDAVTNTIERINCMLNGTSTIILTGGWSHLLFERIPDAVVNPHLVLDGIKVLMHHNPS